MVRMKKLMFLALLSLLSTAVFAQTMPASATVDGGFRINGRIAGLSDTTKLVLAQYFGSTSYFPKDTARVDAQGRFVFEGAKKLPGGLYLVVPPNQRFLELIITDQQFSFETDTANAIANMRVTGSKENQLFYGFQQGLNKFYDEARAIDVQKKLRQDAVSTTLFNKQLASIQKKAQAYRDSFMTANKGTFTVKLLQASDEPNPPAPPKAANGRPDSLWTFTYYKKHYFDGFDFSDERLTRTPMLQKKLDRYMKELTVQQVDSLSKSADYLVSLAKADKEMLSYTIWYITSQYERPKIMGADGLFVHMAEKYYLTGIMPTTDPSTVENIRKRVNTLKPLLIGKTFQMPVVSDTLKRPLNFANLKADYTIVLFYAPHCGHCREATPKLKQALDAHKGKPIDVIAIAVDDSPEDWKKFIQEFKLNGWIHGYDYTFRTVYREQYDVATTPTVYVLDKNRKIIGRGLPADQAEDFIQFYERQKAALVKK